MQSVEIQRRLVQIPNGRDGGRRRAGGPHDPRVHPENGSLPELDGEVWTLSCFIPRDQTPSKEELVYLFFKFIITVVLLQVSVHHRTPDPQRTRLHGAQRAQPQDPGTAEHDPPGDLPAARDLQDKSTDTSSVGE